MTTQQQIQAHLNSLPQPKQADMRTLHNLICGAYPACKQWFHDGTDDTGKVVANPTIGYGQLTMQYAKGPSKEWFRVGLSANTTGISVYILGLKDKTYLAQTYGKTIGKAGVTGYCIKFKKLNDINVDVLMSALQYALELPA